MTVPGPFTMAQQAQDDFYGDRAALAMAYAAAVNDEVLDLYAAGADYVQIDEPYLDRFVSDIFPQLATDVKSFSRVYKPSAKPDTLDVIFRFKP